MNIVQKAQLTERGRRPADLDPYVFANLDQQFTPFGPTRPSIDTLYEVRLALSASFVHQPEDKMPLVAGVHHCLKNLTYVIYEDVFKSLDRIESKLYNRAKREELLDEIRQLRERLMEVNPDAIERV